MKLYLSGPMSGHPDLNFPAFTAETKRLRELGHEVFSPHEEPPMPRWEWGEWIISDLIVLMSGDFDGLALLDGWEKSPGCNIEKVFAERIGVRVHNAAKLNAEASPREIIREVHQRDRVENALPTEGGR